MLAPLQRQLRLGLTVRALEPQHDLLRRLRLLVEHGLRLAPVAGLLAVVAALALGDRGGLHGTHGGTSVGRGVGVRYGTAEMGVWGSGGVVVVEEEGWGGGL